MNRRRAKEDSYAAPPEPGEVRELCQVMRQRVDALERDFIAAYEASRTSGGGGMEGRSAISDSNPTMNVATSKAKKALRGSLWSIFETMKDGAALLLQSVESLDKALEKAHGRYTFTEAQRMGRGELAGDFPRTARDSDIQEARDAQARRRARGEI